MAHTCAPPLGFIHAHQYGPDIRILLQAVGQAPAMDSKAMADSFLEALENGTSQPVAQNPSAAGTSPPHTSCAQAGTPERPPLQFVLPWSPALLLDTCSPVLPQHLCLTQAILPQTQCLCLSGALPPPLSPAQKMFNGEAFFSMYVPLGAGLPPPPELPLPPGLDSASAVPYQQKPIDLFKAIFEASDSDEDEEEEATEKEDTERKAGVTTGKEGRPLGSAGPAAGAQVGVKAAEQAPSTAGIPELCHHACHTRSLSVVLYASELSQLQGMLEPL